MRDFSDLLPSPETIKGDVFYNPSSCGYWLNYYIEDWIQSMTHLWADRTFWDEIGLMSVQYAMGRLTDEHTGGIVNLNSRAIDLARIFFADYASIAVMARAKHVIEEVGSGNIARSKIFEALAQWQVPPEPINRVAAWVTQQLP